MENNRTMVKSLALLRRLLMALCALALVVAAGCAGASHPPRSIVSEADATPPPGLTGPGLMAWQVLHDPRPARDLISLALRFGHAQGPISPVARATPLNAKLGQEDTFWILTGSSQYKQIQARLVYITPHVYDYVEDNTQVDLGALRQSADLFESSIYVTDRRFFGSEWSPGIDDDAHITILNAPDIYAGDNGYFSSADEFPASVAPFSNQREMIYVRIGNTAVTPGTDTYNATLAHEFQHLIHWHTHPTDPAWVNEGMAVLAQHINGYDASGFDTAFFADPGVQLDSWSNGDDLAAHYGAGYLFIDYFAEHYGGYQTLRELLADPAQVPLNFDDVLAENGYSDRFDDVFKKWVMANVLNDVPQGSNLTYVYKTVQDEHAQPQTSVTSLPFSDQTTVAQYAAHYYALTAQSGTDQTLNVAFTGAPTVPLVTAKMPAPATSFWWSNRGDNMDSTLTRTIDLTNATSGPIALDFSLWYDLEPNYDYGYVEVSSNGGQTWQPLAITGSHSDNPNGQNEGNGLTGTNAGDPAAWTPVSVDLSKFAGKKIEVRFESVTDDELNDQGMAVANITVPAIGFVDNPQSASGWDAKGWLSTKNVLPENYAVQVALLSGDGSLIGVQSVPINTASGAGTLTIAHFGAKAASAIVSVAALAPATTIPASYSISLMAS